jgi:hypothetical protein
MQMSHVQTAYDQAQEQFINRCVRKQPTLTLASESLPTTNTEPNTTPATTAAQPVPSSQSQVALVLVNASSKAKIPTTSTAATLLLRIKPWARVSIDQGAEIVTPPTKIISIKPGEREISIITSNSQQILIKRNFTAGQLWVLDEAL